MGKCLEENESLGEWDLEAKDMEEDLLGLDERQEEKSEAGKGKCV